MPFQVFRRHQKKMLAVLAIMAMIAFTLDFSLFRDYGGDAAVDAKVVELPGQTVYRSDLARLVNERSIANVFLSRLDPRLGLRPLGGTSDKEMVDALILEKKAEELGIPATAEVGNKWLNNLFNSSLRPQDFERVRRESFSQMTGEDLLETLARQVRLIQVRTLPGGGQVTPLDVYQAYRDQHEHISAHAVPFHVADYLDKVPDPSESEARAYFERYKDVLPDADRETPGFKVPQKARVEAVSIDVDALTRDIKAKLTEQELRDAFAARPKDFVVPSPELPTDLFAGDRDAKLTPRVTDPFTDVRPQIESTLADERAREQVEAKFEAMREAGLQAFSEKYDEVRQENLESDTKAPLPEPGDLFQKAAKQVGLGESYRDTGLITRAEAEALPALGKAKEGTNPFGDANTFAEAVFAPSEPLYDLAEFSDIDGRRYLAWKTIDTPARVPTFDEARAEVVRAWKTEKARPLAEADAKALAAEARSKSIDLKTAAGKRTVLTIGPLTRMTPSFVFSPTQMIPSRVNEIDAIPQASDALRDALFGLSQNEPAVAANVPKTTYYALGFERRTPADLNNFFNPFGSAMSLRNEVYGDEARALGERWMASLRAEVGLPSDWIPPDEARAEAEGTRRE